MRSVCTSRDNWPKKWTIKSIKTPQYWSCGVLILFIYLYIIIFTFVKQLKYIQLNDFKLIIIMEFDPFTFKTIAYSVAIFLVLMRFYLFYKRNKDVYKKFTPEKKKEAIKLLKTPKMIFYITSLIIIGYLLLKNKYNISLF